MRYLWNIRASRRGPRLAAVLAVPSVVAALYFVMAVAASAQETGCVSCHRDKMKGSSIHEAMQARMGCRICHGGIINRVMPHKSSTAIGKGLNETVPALCYSCHEKKSFTRSVVHAALEQGCSDCHDPHATENGKLLAAPQPDICVRCHDGALFTGKNVHGAMGMGCTACHDPHASQNAKLLRDPQPDICYRCHDRKMFARMDVHGALGTGCTGCHGPHAAGNGKLLVLPVPEVCFACHDRRSYTGQDVHGPAAAGLCLACHLPHSSDQGGLLVQSLASLCVTCHAGYAERSHATQGPSISTTGAAAEKEQGEERNVEHARPEKPFACGGCHDPHSRDSHYLLRTVAGPAGAP